jgi:DNA end-binding protein Ku
LVKVAIRTKETLALLRERDGALVLQTMLWPDEVRDSEFAKPDDSVDVKPQEVEMAESYIATLEAEFDPSRYHSDYREALEALVEAKIEGLPMPEPEEEEEETADVVDLVAALRASVDAAKKRRQEGGASSDSKKPAAKKSAAKKAPAKKAAAKKTSKTAAKKTAKTAAKKTAARKSA